MKKITTRHFHNRKEKKPARIQLIISEIYYPLTVQILLEFHKFTVDVILKRIYAVIVKTMTYPIVFDLISRLLGQRREQATSPRKLYNP